MANTKTAANIKTGDTLILEDHTSLTKHRVKVLNVAPYSTHSVMIDHPHRNGGPLMVIDKTATVEVE